VGYVRVDEADEREIKLLLKDIAACCLRARLRLTRTFVDRGYEGKELARPGLVDLREALKDHEGLVVVVPTLDHLSPSGVIRSPLLLMVHRRGGRVLVANEPNGHTDDRGETQYGVWVDVDEKVGEPS
jgi:DNA invertase Pin-like site-specific DNA recombinase